MQVASSLLVSPLLFLLGRKSVLWWFSSSFNYLFAERFTNLLIFFFFLFTRFYIIHVFFQGTNTGLELFGFLQDISFLGEVTTLPYIAQEQAPKEAACEPEGPTSQLCATCQQLTQRFSKPAVEAE